MAADHRYGVSRPGPRDGRGVSSIASALAAALDYPFGRGIPINGGSSMDVTIHVPGMLREYCEGAREIHLSAPSVRAALEDLERRYPALHRNVCDETGAVRRHVNLFVNTSNVRDREGLDTSLAPGDVVTILPAVSGG